MAMNPRLLRPRATRGGGDPLWSQVSLLLKFDGMNGSTTFTDSSSNALTVTANGNAQISTAQSKFGGASGYFDGDGDFLTIPNNGAFDFGVGDFTIELWARVADTDQIRVPFNFGVGNANAGISTSGLPDFSRAFEALICASATPIVTGEWQHHAYVRSAGVVSIYIDGVSVASGADTEDYSSTGDIEIGGINALSFFHKGFLDEFRVTKAARYTGSSFAVPTAAFPTS